MKKFIFTLLSLSLFFSILSCGTTASTMDEGAIKQAAINKSFDKVYAAHESKLVLEGAKVYKVKKGDTLTSITKRFYAGKDENGYYFPLIMLASHNVVADPELITPGMKLTIPDFDANITNRKIGKQLSAYFRDLSGVYREKDTPAAHDILPHLIEIADQLAKDAEPEATAAPVTNSSTTEKPKAVKKSSDDLFTVAN